MKQERRKEETGNEEKEESGPDRSKCRRIGY